MTGTIRKSIVTGIIVGLVMLMMVVTVFGFLIYQHRSAELAGNEAATAQRLRMIAARDPIFQ
jgi:sorbitol-specific phosphotransferase system component IIC